MEELEERPIVAGGGDGSSPVARSPVPANKRSQSSDEGGATGMSPAGGAGEAAGAGLALVAFGAAGGGGGGETGNSSKADA